jgi:hypothetical protein
MNKAPKAALRSQLPGCHSFSAYSVANIQKNPQPPKEVADFFSFLSNFTRFVNLHMAIMA